MKNLQKLAAIVLVGLSLNLKAQKVAPKDGDRNPNQKIEAARIGMITNRLDLTSEQATAFWPVYNEFEAKKTEVKKDLRKHLSESRSLASNDEKIMTELKEMITLRQKDVDLDKEYLSKFLKVINPRQVSELFRTEQMFKQMLLKRLEYRYERGDKGDKGPKGPK
ncbi:MAG: Spy/CpxP family protein refolding chaperone [Bacteroidota bacterium]